MWQIRLGVIGDDSGSSFFGLVHLNVPAGMVVVAVAVK